MDVHDERKEHSHYNDANKEDELQSGGNHIVMGNLLTQNQKTAAQASPTSSENSSDSDLVEVANRCWVEESLKVPVVVSFAERLEIQSNCDFAKYQ